MNKEKIKREEIKTDARQELKIKYQKVELEMSYEEVKDIMGIEGKLFAESLDSSGTYQVYLWKTDESFEGIEVHFTDGKVTAKSQLGLE